MDSRGSFAHRSPSVLSYSPLSTVVDRDASDPRRSTSVPSFNDDGNDSEYSEIRPPQSTDRPRCHPASNVGDPLEGDAGRDGGDPSSDPSSTLFKPAPIPAIEQVHPKVKWRNALSGWYLEIFWSFVSSGCFVSLVLILHRFNDQPPPKWPLGITINAAIALLATVSRICFEIPVCESVSQLKWLWYREERPLADLQVFDEASRGPWGSLKLLVTMRRTKSWILGLLSALVITTSVLTSTLTQSAVTYRSRLEPVPGLPSANFLRATEFWSTSASDFWQDYFTGRVASEIYTGLNYPVGDKLETNQPFCATSECRWPLFNTLEVCTKTWNITKHLDIEMKNGRMINISLPNGASLVRNEKDPEPKLRPDFVWLSSSNGPISYDANSSELTSAALSNLLVIYHSPGSSPPLAFEVLFHLCVNRYHLTISENVVSRELKGSSAHTVVGPVKVELMGGQVRNVSSILSPDKDKIKFPIGGTGFSIMARALSVILNGTYNENGGEDPLAAAATRFAHLFQTAESDKSRKLLSEGEDPVMGVVANVSRNVAASLSKGIATNNEYRESHETDNVVKGENLGPVTFVSVRWPWLLFLGSQILVSMTFFIIIIIRTAVSTVGVTKSSLLPVLFAISPEERALVEDSTEGKYHEEFTKMADRATGVVGSLSTGVKRRGWVLKGARDEI